MNHPFDGSEESALGQVATRMPGRGWLTRNVFAIGMLSLFSDMGHELTTAVLPLFLALFGGGAAALGTIEGVSDAVSSLVKFWMSLYSDRVRKRKPILAVGYFLTAVMGCFAFVTAWWQLLVIRGVARIGRGARGPVRDALLSESVPPEAYGIAGIYVGIVDAMERALAADLPPIAQRGVGYGALATANSFGDLLSSICVGYLWSHVSFNAGFLYGAAFTLLGAGALLLLPTRRYQRPIYR